MYPVDWNGWEQGMVAKDVKMHRSKDEFGKAMIALSTEQSITFARTPWGQDTPEQAWPFVALLQVHLKRYGFSIYIALVCINKSMLDEVAHYCDWFSSRFCSESNFKKMANCCPEG